MRVSDILRAKGTNVVTIKPTDTVRQLVRALADHHVGALVVSADGQSVDGIISERDVVRRLNDTGESLLDCAVEEVMTTNVQTTDPDAELVELATVMTQHRFRHLPVLEDGALCGVVSLGDVVKSRIDELQSERDQLTAYIQS